jgi:pSer/pThr/pTyr-binding forkhead associated (FHA) protein
MSNAFLCDANHPATKWNLPTEPNGECVIGREAPAQIILAATAVSRRHAAIEYRHNQHWLSDLGSRNGTFVNGKLIDQNAVRLIDGDEIVIAGAIALRFNDPTQTAKGKRVGKLKGIWLDENAHDVWIDGTKIDPPLSSAQMTLLGLIYNAKGNLVTRDEIVTKVWASDEPQGVSEEAIDGLIKRLRARLREASENDYVEVLRGRGIRLKSV